MEEERKEGQEEEKRLASAALADSTPNPKFPWKPRVDPFLGFTLSEDKSTFTVLADGKYLVGVILLNEYGKQFSPVLLVNDTPVLNGYSSGPGYQTVHMSGVFQLFSGDQLSVTLQPDSYPYPQPNSFQLLYRQ
eukprot:CAMPEP_0174251336 /NCGR_PEP_ID=MMETSP0439-20130205/1188_1 /TAXON_ID=0 /ORGANISM="Stereomyxa ramosa, Strain Chinc5" /LENGTH=133 /DNA_ID=CAMNT_0015331617 /DNA_START=65 /DNA_END=463 /DNA_ORIENTATION=+